MWRCSKIKPTCQKIHGTKITSKQRSVLVEPQSVGSLHHAHCEDCKDCRCCCFFCCRFFSMERPNQEARCWGTVFIDFRVFVDHRELYKIQSASRHQDQSSTVLSEHFRDLLSTSFSFPERLVQSEAV